MLVVRLLERATCSSARCSAVGSPTRSSLSRAFASLRSYAKLGRAGSGRISDTRPPFVSASVRTVGLKRGDGDRSGNVGSDGTIPARGPGALRGGASKMCDRPVGSASPPPDDAYRIAQRSPWVSHWVGVELRAALACVGAALRHDASIQHRHCPLRMCRIPLVMRHDTNRRAVLIQLAQQRHHAVSVCRVATPVRR